jgi:hypothetical protein
VVDDRDGCPDIGAKGHRGCPLIDRDVEVRVKHRKLAGTVTASDRACRGVGKAVVYSVQKGRDRVAGRLPVSARGNFKLRFGPRFEGRVYARIGAGTNPLVGLCGPAVSKTVSIG